MVGEQRMEKDKWKRTREIPGVVLMDRTEAKGWRAIFDHKRHRNESFLHRYDYRLVLLMMTAVDSLNGYNMATFLAVQGFSAIIPLFIITVLFAVPFLFTELFIGGFAGTGLIWSIKNAVPLAGGIGLAMLIQAFLQLVEDIRNIGELSQWTSIILIHLDDWYSCDNQWHNTKMLEQLMQGMSNDKDEIKLSCYSLKEFGNCFKHINATHTSCRSHVETFYSDATAHFQAYYFMVKRLEAVGALDGFHVFRIIIFLTIITAIASLSFRLLATYGKFAVFISFFLQSSILICCAVYSRWKMSYGFKDIIFLSQDFGQGLLSYHTWIRSAGLVFRAYGIAHGAMAAVARRSHQGKGESIFKECIMVVSITFLSQVLIGFFHIVAAPGFILKDPYNDRPEQHQFFHSFPWLWGTYSYRVLHNDFIKGGRGLILLFLLLQGIRSLGKIIIYYDTVRVGIIEASSWKKFGRFRVWILVGISVAVFGVGSFQFFVPWGSFAGAWAFSLITAYLFRAILAAALTVCVTWVYTLKRALRDVSLVSESLVPTWVYNVGTVYGKWVLPAILIASGVTETVLGRLDPWYVAIKTMGDEFVTIVEVIILHVAIALFSVSILYVFVKIRQQCQKGRPVKDLLKPTKRWGPCEIRFWLGEYEKLRFRYNLLDVPLNTVQERAIVLKRRAVAQRRISRELESDMHELRMQELEEEEEEEDDDE